MNATAPLYNDNFKNSKGSIKRTVYRNGTIEILIDNKFSYYEVAPKAYVPDFKRLNYTDGSYVIIYEETGRKVFYPAPLSTGVNSKYEIATAVRSIEDFPDTGMQRVVYVNGTIIIRNPKNNTFTYEKEPLSFILPIQVVNLTTCSYIVYDNINDTKTLVNCPPASGASTKDLAVAITEETFYRDGSVRRVFFNGTIARFGPNNIFQFYEVPPKIFWMEFAITTYTNGSKLVDYTNVNETKRFTPAPLPTTAS